MMVRKKWCDSELIIVLQPIKQTDKSEFSEMEIVRKIFLMLLCSFFALVLHPLFHTIGLDFYTESPFIVLH
ncbi:MAG: hypothetical protein IJ528_03640, partial [Bacteroidaceae bacterium]|nr:hypothetical protein [Bacteroidaceae bacterium]